MADPIQRQKGPIRRRKRGDWGRSFARFLCFLFALVGAVPLSGGALLRSEPLQHWAASETSRLLLQELGLKAKFTVELSLIPLCLAVNELTVLATDSEKPAIVADSIEVRPRFFSLLAGRIDVGDITLEDTQVRLVIRDGKVQNVAYHFPDTRENEPLDRAPFRSLAVTNAQLDIQVDDTHVKTGSIDIDAIVEKALSFDIALRAGRSTVSATRTTDDGVEFVDDDQLCELDLRALLSKEEVLIRRLSLSGTIDQDPAVNTFGQCGTQGAEQLSLRLSQLRMIPKEKGLPAVRGHVLVRAPLQLIERFAPRLTTSGWAAFSGEVAFDESMRLPEVAGTFSGANMSAGGFVIAEEMNADVLVSTGVVRFPRMRARWGRGEAIFQGIEVSPFEPKIPFRIEHVSTNGIDMPGVMRDIGVTEHAWVDWNFGKTEVDAVEGTGSPFRMDGAFDGHTRDFVVWDRGFDDPTRKRMFGIRQVHAKGRFRAHATSLDFYASQVKFGKSSLPVDLVSVGFRDNPLIVRLKEGGGRVDLSDISPIADLTMAGTSDLDVELSGPMTHPVLTGSLAVKGLQLAGYDAGNVHKSDVRFEPLFVEFTNLEAQKGGLEYRMPKARLSFDGPATVEFSGKVESPQFVLSDFLSAFHFSDDPRFDGLSLKGKADAQVRYLLGGPRDTCGSGRLSVSGKAELDSARALGEQYDGGSGAFSLEWFDIEAGLRGMRVSLPQLTLRKGSGTFFAAVDVEPGGIISGDVVGTRIPVSRLTALGPAFSQTDGFLSGAGQLGGTLQSLAFSADVTVTNLKAQDMELPPSELNLELIPNPPPPTQETKRTSCGRLVATDQPSAGTNHSDGTFVANGRLFGGQIELFDAKITRHEEPRFSGRALLTGLDIPAILALSGVESERRALTGTVSGEVTVADFTAKDPFGSSIRLGISEAELSQNGLTIALADKRAGLRLLDRKWTSRYLALRATAKQGQSAFVDADFSLDDQLQVAAHLNLRPTDLAVVASALPGVERAKGGLEGSLELSGHWSAPSVTGNLEVRDGLLKLAGFDAPVENFELQIGMDGKGMRVEKGSATWAGGRIRVNGNAPLSQGQLGRISLGVVARSVALPLGDGLFAKFNADLNLSVPPLSQEGQELPLLSGRVDLLSGSYEKAMSMTADIATLTNRGEKTDVSDYDEAEASVRLDLLLVSREALKVKNALVETTLFIDPSGIRVTGTDERFGAVGTLRIDGGGQVHLRRNNFDVQGGLVRFNDPTELRPEVDVTAITEYRRFGDRGTTQGGTTGSSATTGTPLAGTWRILMHAYGPPETLKVDLSSDPPLSQDDIFLLLTVGLTRTELDQSSNTGVGSSVALEALGSLSGAESAVTRAVPIDEFRFGSTYSTRSGRTEPTVTIGKRLSDRIRASVTTSLSEATEVRSNVEYRATDHLSVEGTYDNATNVATAAGGNIGGDVRWRLEFK